MAEVYDSESHLQESTTKLQLTCGNTNVLSLIQSIRQSHRNPLMVVRSMTSASWRKAYMF
jgi:hypothetical protein